MYSLKNCLTYVMNQCGNHTSKEMADLLKCNRASFFRPASIAEKISDSENVCEENQIVDEQIDTAPISIEGREGKFKI